MKPVILGNMCNCLTQKGPACSAYMTAHLLQYYGIEKDPLDIYGHLGRFVDSEAVAPWQVASYINNVLADNGCNTRYNFSAMCELADIYAELQNGGPVPILLMCSPYSKTFDELHYVLVTGIDDENVYLIDSLHKSGVQPYNRVVIVEDFAVMWSLENADFTANWCDVKDILLISKNF